MDCAVNNMQHNQRIPIQQQQLLWTGSLIVNQKQTKILALNVSD